MAPLENQLAASMALDFRICQERCSQWKQNSKACIVCLKTLIGGKDVGDSIKHRKAQRKSTVPQYV